MSISPIKANVNVLIVSPSNYSQINNLMAIYSTTSLNNGIAPIETPAISNTSKIKEHL